MFNQGITGNVAWLALCNEFQVKKSLPACSRALKMASDQSFQAAMREALLGHKSAYATPTTACMHL
jgi:hypothetical protein